MKNQLLAISIILFSVVNMSSAEEKKKINSFGDKSHKYSTFKTNTGKNKSGHNKRSKPKKSDRNSQKSKQPNHIPVDLIGINH
jgi:hypothetical protein